MPLQTDITFAITGCQFISVFDATGFSHQWLVRVINRYKFTVVSHRGQKQFNVAVMGFKKNPFYIKKKNYFTCSQFFFRVYVDDVIVSNHTLEKHISYLHSIFQLFDSYGINQ